MYTIEQSGSTGKEAGQKEAEEELAVTMHIIILNVVVSVAASVIVDLLLMSGDIEENPGPGGSYKSKCRISLVCQRFLLIIDLDYNSVDVWGAKCVKNTCKWHICISPSDI